MPGLDNPEKKRGEKYDRRPEKQTGLDHEKRRRNCSRRPDDFTDDATDTCGVRQTSFGSCHRVKTQRLLPVETLKCKAVTCAG